MIILLHQASRFLTGDWASGLGSESGFLCQGYPVIFYTTQVHGIINIMIILIVTDTGCATGWNLLYHSLQKSCAGSNSTQLDVCHLKQGLTSLSWKQDWTNQPELGELCRFIDNDFCQNPLIDIFLNPLFSVFFNYGDDLHHFEPGELLSGGLLLAPALCSSPAIPCPDIWKVCCILIVGILS